MSFSCGIVGLPNVGKSTLFNALTRSEVAAENYPFCTIEPHKAIVEVPDLRIRDLAILSKSKKRLYSTIEFVDIAGLVKGASKGEGMGNQFISNIQQVDALVHVIRLFEDEKILRDSPVDPIADLRIIHQELILYDLEQATKHHDRLQKNLRRNTEIDAPATIRALEHAIALLENENLLSPPHDLHAATSAPSATKNPSSEAGTPPDVANAGGTSNDVSGVANADAPAQAKDALSLAERELLEQFHFITMKPLILVGNLSEVGVSTPEKNPHYVKLAAHCAEQNIPFIELAVELEREVCDVGESLLGDLLSPYLSAVGLKESGCSRLIRMSYKQLSLITFFTTGEMETRAWTVPIGTPAPLAAGRIHSDIQRGFIKADIISAEALIACGSIKSAREQGKLRLEGKEYIIVDGDVCHFKFNV